METHIEPGSSTFSPLKSRRLRMAALAAVAFAATVAGGVVLASRDASQGGQLPGLDVVQDVSASDQGITLTVVRASFSGSGSLLLVDAEIEDGGDTRPAIRIPAESFEATSLQMALPGEPGFLIPPGGPATVRAAAATPGTDPALNTTAIDVRQPDGTWQRVEGSWRLPLRLGGSADAVLWMTHWQPGSGSSEGGVEVRPVSAVTSGHETLVTLELTGPAGIGDLILPSIGGSSPPVFGARVGQEGNLITLSFPPVDTSEPLTIDLGDLVVPGEAAATGYVDIDLAQALDRQGVEGAFADVVLVDAADQVPAPGGGYEVLRVEFVRTTPAVESNAINVYVSGSYSDARPFSLRLADGTVLEPQGSGTGFPVDASGNVVEGTTYIHFAFAEDRDIHAEGLAPLRQGPMRLSFGTPSQVLYGDWQVTFDPE